MKAFVAFLKSLNSKGLAILGISVLDVLLGIACIPQGKYEAIPLVILVVGLNVYFLAKHPNLRKS